MLVLKDINRGNAYSHKLVSFHIIPSHLFSMQNVPSCSQKNPYQILIDGRYIATFGLKEGLTLYNLLRNTSCVK